MSSSPPLPDRKSRLKTSLTTLLTHPAVNSTGPHAAYIPPPTTQTAYLVQTLFNDLVYRELGTTSRPVLETHLSRTRSVATSPSLSDPHFIRHLSTPHPPQTLSTPATLLTPTKPVSSAAATPSAAKLHLALQRARRAQQRVKLAARQPGPQTRASGATRKRTRAQTALGAEEVRAPDEPPEVTALRPDKETVRRTRSASSKLRKGGSGGRSECCFCPDPELFDGCDLKSELIGPFVDRKGKAKLFVHFDCACWAPQVYTDVQSGQLRRVYDEYCRGRQLKCSDCGGRGATIGCYVQRCKRVFHLRCLSRSNALRVERFFVAFCENHAHLGKKRSYKNLMEAATIADVAAAHRREDSTFGLDAPHSRYTQLRRRETEVIFSSRWGICSHNGAFETNKVLFSHKRRAVLKKGERLSHGDRTRSLLASAFDIASGRLAYMSVAGKDKSLDTMTAVEARAALASREHTSLLLLRNLRRAPQWTADEIAIVKRSAEKPGDTSATDAKTLNSRNASSSGKRGAPVLDDGQDQGDAVGSDAGTPRTRASKRRRVNVSSSSEGEEAKDVATDGNEMQGRSAQLPSFKKSSSSSLEKGTESVVKSPIKSNIDTNDIETEGGKKSPKGSTPKKKRTALAISKDEKAANGEVQNDRQGLAGKVKSAWETFLEEQLPKERLLRPDDPEADAMRNMARLWSLLCVEAREEYQERARRAGISAGNSAVHTEKETRRAKASGRTSDTKETVQRSLPREDLGLFAGRQGSKGIGRNSNSADERPCSSVAPGSQPSVSLPRKIRVQRRAGNVAQYEEFVAVDWDDLLPTSLEELTPGNRSNVERVRPPPSRG